MFASTFEYTVLVFGYFHSGMKSFRVLVRLFWGLQIAGLIPLLVFVYKHRHPLKVEPITTQGFLVDTPVCRIPDINPFDKSVAQFIRINVFKIQCREQSSITQVEGDMIRINQQIATSLYKGEFKNCRYQPIRRDPLHPDTRVKYGKLSTPFSHDVKVKDDFIRVLCYSTSGNVIYRNYHALVISRNKTEKRCDYNTKSHMKRNKPREIMNVLMIGLDSFSRLNYMRQMPLTRKYLVETLNATELLGYTKVADNTFENIVPLTTGKFAAELPWNKTMRHEPFDKYFFIWNNFSMQGYRTLYAEDAPYTSGFTYLKGGFRRAPADHYIRAFGIALEGDNSIWNNEHRCVGDTMETDIVLRYVRDFATLYRHKPHFGFTFFTRLSHDNANDAGFADSPHVKFLQRIHREGLLEKTVLIYFSDHGIRFGPMRMAYVGKLEERLPYIAFVLPAWFKTKYPGLVKNLRTNSRRLTTPFDVYETLKNILYFNGKVEPASITKRGISLFSEIPRDRSCDHASIEPHWCMCLNNVDLPTSSHHIKAASEIVILHINDKLRNHHSSCNELKIKKINKAVQMTSNDQVLRYNDVINRTFWFRDRAFSLQIFQLTFETYPGNALFEASVGYDERNNYYTMAGDVSRINRYGNQSACIDDFQLKKFCYCK